MKRFTTKTEDQRGVIYDLGLGQRIASPNWPVNVWTEQVSGSRQRVKSSKLKTVKQLVND